MSDDVDDFFNQMILEEQKKLKKVSNILHQRQQIPRKKNEVPANAVTSTTANIQHTLEIKTEHKSRDVTIPVAVEATIPNIATLQSPEQIMQSLQHDLSILNNPNAKREIKHKSLQKLSQIIQRNPSQILKEIFVQDIFQPILRLFSDPVESCREQSAHIMLNFVSAIRESASLSWKYTFPVLKSRWCRKDQDLSTNFTESSEEVRVLLMRILTAYIKYCHKSIEDYMCVDDICDHILTNAYTDFFIVKKESCICTVEMCKRFPNIMQLKSQHMIERLKPILTFHRADVRVEAIKAVGALITYCGASEKLLDKNDELPTILKNLASIDNSLLVRQTMFKTVCEWIESMQDRYSYDEIILEMLLRFICDDCDDLKSQAYSVLIKLGMEYEKMNEEKVKPILDYEIDKKLQLKLQLDNLSFPPPILSRPSIGIRLLVKEHARKLLPIILEGLTDWTMKVRLVSSKIIQKIIIFCENDITQFLDKILKAIFKVINDDDESQVRYECTAIGRFLGNFTFPDAYLPYIFTYLKPEFATSPKLLASVLLTLRCIFQGSKSQFFYHTSGPIYECMRQLSLELMKPHMIYHDLPDIKISILEIVATLSEKKAFSEETIDISTFITLILKICSQPNFSLEIQAEKNKAVSNSGSVHQNILQSRGLHILNAISQNIGLQSLEKLLEKYYPLILDAILQSVESWDKISPDLYNLKGLVSINTDVGARHFDVLLERVFKRFMGGNEKNSQAYEMRAKLFEILIDLIHNSGALLTPRHLIQIVTEILIPNSIWKHGKWQAECRRMDMICLLEIFKQQLFVQTQIVEILSQDQNFKHIIACLDEESKDHRSITVNLLTLMIPQCSAQLKQEQWKQLYEELLKCMDDMDDAIRVKTAKALSTIFTYIPASLSDMIKQIVDILLIHADDQKKEIQVAVADAINVASSRHKEVQPILIK